MKNFLFACNTKTLVAEPMVGVSCWEQLQGMAGCGILLSNGDKANGIGRLNNAHSFLTKAAEGKIKVIINSEDKFPAKLEIQIHKGTWTEVSWDVFRSWTGKRRVDGETFKGPCYFWLSDEIAK